ncbi:MAG: flagellar hook-basal body complex protein FliE [Acetobacteraceae bacterium]|nr:flagellar hook-basal body complex protein FliE [Acetobacteraceae bacterium]
MTTLPTITVTPSAAADAYARIDKGIGGTEDGFGAMLQRALNSAVQTGHAAETASVQAISGEGNLTELVTALSRAELTLQTAAAVRDRVVQAYQDIMKMPI